MKRLLLFITVLITLNSLGQNIVKPTTEEEYNYLTRGYKEQIENGLDMKKGYDLIDRKIFTPSIGLYSFTVKELYRKDEKEVAAILVIAKSGVSGKDYYICIPYQNPLLVRRYWDLVNSFDHPLGTAYCVVLTSLLAESISYYVSETFNPPPTNTSHLSSIYVMPPTEEEYNYLTKGYKEQIENGLDVKSGYSLKDLFSEQLDSYEFNGKGLVREKNKQLATILVVIGSRENNQSGFGRRERDNQTGTTNNYYVGIPYRNFSLLNKYLEQINKFPNPLEKSFIKLITKNLVEAYIPLRTKVLKKNYTSPR